VLQSLLTLNQIRSRTPELVVPDRGVDHLLADLDTLDDDQGRTVDPVLWVRLHPVEFAQCHVRCREDLFHGVMGGVHGAQDTVDLQQHRCGWRADRLEQLLPGRVLAVLRGVPGGRLIGAAPVRCGRTGDQPAVGERRHQRREAIGGQHATGQHEHEEQRQHPSRGDAAGLQPANPRLIGAVSAREGAGA